MDTSLFAQNLVLAFESMGYGICYIGGLRNNLPAVQELLELPEGTYPFYGLCVGRPADEPMLRPRLPLQGVLFEEHYPEDGEMLSALDGFDDTMLEYFRQRGAGDRIWSQEMVEKFTQPRRIRQRDRSSDHRERISTEEPHSRFASGVGSGTKETNK